MTRSSPARGAFSLSTITRAKTYCRRIGQAACPRNREPADVRPKRNRTVDSTGAAAATFGAARPCDVAATPPYQPPVARSCGVPTQSFYRYFLRIKSSVPSPGRALQLSSGATRCRPPSPSSLFRRRTLSRVRGVDNSSPCVPIAHVSAHHIVRFRSPLTSRPGTFLARGHRRSELCGPSARNGEQRGEGHGAAGRSREEAQPVQRVLLVLVRVSRRVAIARAPTVTRHGRVGPGVGRPTSCGVCPPRHRCFRESLTKSETSRVPYYHLPSPIESCERYVFSITHRRVEDGKILSYHIPLSVGCTKPVGY